MKNSRKTLAGTGKYRTTGGKPEVNDYKTRSSSFKDRSS